MEPAINSIQAPPLPTATVKITVIQNVYYLGRKVSNFAHNIIFDIIQIVQNVFKSIDEIVFRMPYKAPAMHIPVELKVPIQWTPQRRPVNKLKNSLWKNFVFHPRQAKAKIAQKSSLGFGLIKAPKEQITNSNNQTLYFGAGIENNSNTCYISASLQALRFVPFFRKHLYSPQVKHIQLAEQLRSLFARIEGKSSAKSTSTYVKQTISTEQINEFRRVCIDYGWTPKRETSQEDPREFCTFLIGELGFPTFSYKIKISHNFDFPLRVPALDPCQVLTDNHIELPICHETEGTELRQVAGRGFVIEEVEKESIKVPKDAAADTLDQLRLLEKITPVITHQSIQLIDIPLILPIALKRDIHDLHTGQSFKSSKSILPSLFLELTLLNDPSKKARYHLKSIVILEGESADSGHCRTFIPVQTNRQISYVEFDDAKGMLHTEPSAIEGVIRKHGSFYFYEFVAVV